MEPLPYFHRRWVLIFGIILLLALLWPYSPERQPFPVSQQETSVPLQAGGHVCQRTNAGGQLAALSDPARPDPGPAVSRQQSAGE